MGNTLTDKDKQQIEEEVHGTFERIIDKKLEPVNKKLDKLLHKIELLTQGAISTTVGVDAMNDEEREKDKHTHH